MLEAIKSVLKQAAHARSSGATAEAERLYREAAAEAKAKDDLTRAEALLGIAQTRRDGGDRTAASINYSEAITLLRGANATHELASALRHAADLRSELREYAAAGSQIEEAIRHYRTFDPPAPLDLANALRVSALNDEREAFTSWREAETLYATAGMEAGADEAKQHLDRLQHHATPSNN
jgi:tetratricopeptide (TPR) repeat protein